MSDVILGRHHVAIGKTISLVGSVLLEDLGDNYDPNAQLAESGGMVYLAMPVRVAPYLSNLLVVDATTPSSPVRKSKTVFRSGYLDFVSISTNGAYPNILLPGGNLQIWDCTNPLSPSLASDTAMTNPEFWNICWSKSGSDYVAFLNIIGGISYLQVWDITTHSPVFQSSAAEETGDFACYYNDNIFLLGADTTPSNIWRTDVSNPGAITATNWAVPDSLSLYGPVKAANGRLYVVDSGSSFYLWDISALPSHPYQSVTSISKFPSGAAAKDNYLFTGSNDLTPPNILVDSFDVTNEASPVESATATGLDTYYMATDSMVVDGSYIYALAVGQSDALYYLLIFQITGY